MIELSRVRGVLDEIHELVEDLDGRHLDETDALTDSSKAGTARGERRRKKAEISQDLSLLADRLQLVSALVRVEYWHARGEADPLDSGRECQPGQRV